MACGYKKDKETREHGKTQGVIVGRVFVSVFCFFFKSSVHVCLQQILFYGHITEDRGVSHVHV